MESASSWIASSLNCFLGWFLLISISFIFKVISLGTSLITSTSFMTSLMFSLLPPCFVSEDVLDLLWDLLTPNIISNPLPNAFFAILYPPIETACIFQKMFHVKHKSIRHIYLLLLRLQEGDNFLNRDIWNHT